MAETDEGFGIQNIIKKYLSYWPLLLVLGVLAIADAWLYLKVTPKKYLTTAAILIKDEKKGTEDAKMVQAMNQLATNKIVENEIIVLKSMEMMNQVILNLKLYASVYVEDLFQDRLLYDHPPFEVVAKNPESIIKCDRMTVKVDFVKSNVFIAGKKFDFDQWIATNYGVIKLVKGNIPGVAVQEYIVKLENPKKLTELLAEDLEATPVNKLASVINLQLKDAEPQRAEDILSELIDVYNASSLEAKNQLAVNTLAVVNERLAAVAKDLDSIEQKLQLYKSSTGSVDISTESKYFLQNVSDNDQKLAEVERKIRALNDVDRRISENSTAILVAPSSLDLDDPILSRLIGQLYEAEMQYEDLKTTTAVNSAIMRGLKDKTEKLKPVIKQNIKSHISSLEQSRSSLSSANNRYSSVLNTMPAKEKEIIEISREQSKKSDIYNFLLEKREEAALSLSASVTDSRVIDKARTTVKPVSPKMMYVIAVSLGLSFILASIIIYLKELFKRTILNKSEIEDKLELPVVAEINFDNTKEPIVTGVGKRTEIAEQFRRLRSSLPYIGIRGNRKKLLITSSISEEGKSFVAINLAVSIAIAGKKVALVEFDLLNPSICNKLSLSYTHGISDFIEGKCWISEIVNKYIDIDNLWIVPAGADHDNPSELLLDNKVAELFAYLTSEYDYVIIDSAPVGLLSDAFVLAEFCDATLFVVRHQVTPKSMLDRLTKDTAISSLKNMSIVYNGIKTNSSFIRSYYKKHNSFANANRNSRLKAVNS